MSCMLAITGYKLNIDKLLRFKLVPDTTWVKGEARISSRPNGKKRLTSGAKYLVSDAGFDNFKKQKSDTIKFLKHNKNIITKIMKMKKVDGGTLDFGIEMRDVAAQYDSFCPELIKLAGELGLGIELSQYPK